MRPEQPPREISLPARLPLVGFIDSRSADSDLDSRIINGFVEIGEDKSISVVKRPGVEELYSLGGQGFGMFGEYSIFRTGTSPNFTTTIYRNGQALGTLNSARQYTGTRVLIGADSEFWLFHNRTGLYYTNGSTITTIPYAGQSFTPITASITNGSPVVTHSSSIPQPYYEVTGTGIPARTTILTIDSPTQFTMSANAQATNGSASLTLTPTAPPFNPRVVSNPTHLGRGAAYLNKSVYLLSYNSTIIGSDPDNLKAWSPLNFIFAYSEADQPLAISKQLSHLVVFKEFSTEFFRDAGASPGSPLERVEGLKLDIGVFNIFTVRQIGDTLFWMSQREDGQRSVHMLRELKDVEIASPAVKRILRTGTNWFALTIAISGATFYILTGIEAETSLVYNVSANHWTFWSALGEAYFPFFAASNVDGEIRLQHYSNGKIYRMREDLLDDAGQEIVMDIFPPEFDGGVRKVKYLNKMHLVADQEVGSYLDLRVNDSNRQSDHWTNWRRIALDRARPVLHDCGSFYKRAFHFRHSAPTRCRLRFVELDLMVGEI